MKNFIIVLAASVAMLFLSSCTDLIIHSGSVYIPLDVSKCRFDAVPLQLSDIDDSFIQLRDFDETQEATICGRKVSEACPPLSNEWSIGAIALMVTSSGRDQGSTIYACVYHRVPR